MVGEIGRETGVFIGGLITLLPKGGNLPTFKRKRVILQDKYLKG